MHKYRIISILARTIGYIIAFIAIFLVIIGICGLTELLMGTNFTSLAKYWYFILIGIGLFPFAALLIGYGKDCDEYW